MKSMTKKTLGPAKTAGPSDPAVEAVFGAYPKPLRARLLALRRLILNTAAATKGVGELQETLKWGQPSYLTMDSKSGSTIRIDRVKASADQYAVYFHCQTDLVATFRELYPNELTTAGKRAVIFNTDDAIPEAALRHCVALALTYHLRKRKARSAS
jgi:fructose-specific component phosphotransferase system IIB-like protein